MLALGVFVVQGSGCKRSKPPRIARLHVQARQVDTQSTRYLGPLKLLRALELRASDERFGGLSGMCITEQGRLLTLVTDKGCWIQAHLELDPQGRLRTLSRWQIGPLRGRDGKALEGAQADAESLERGPQGQWLVTFERHHRLWQYWGRAPQSVATPAMFVLPDIARYAPYNGGIETMAALPGHRLVVVTESFHHTTHAVRGWILGSGPPIPIDYPVSGGFVPTDAAVLPNGQLWLLERRFLGVGSPSIRIRRVPIAELGKKLHPHLIARLDPAVPVDNFEGLAVHRWSKDSALVYLVSDNNFSSSQRTLLYQFRVQLQKN